MREFLWEKLGIESLHCYHRKRSQLPTFSVCAEALRVWANKLHVLA